MARYVIRVLASTTTIADLTTTIQQAEELDFTAVSLAAGTVGGKPANILTMIHGTPSGSVSLAMVDGTASEDAQADQLTSIGDEETVLSYAGVYVVGTLRNVALSRS